LGFALCFTFGPAFFALVQTSIDNGSKSGILIACGVVLSDALMMSVVVFGLNFLPQIPHIKDFINIIGIVILLILGIGSFQKKRKPLIYPSTPFGNLVFYFSKGFFLNLLNPPNYAFLVATSFTLRNSFSYDTAQVAIFWGTSLLGALLAEVLIAVYAPKLKRFITEQFLLRLNQVAGLVFIVAALRILIGII
jgi:threonine/homoserine/homoserine lactone efflux protein